MDSETANRTRVALVSSDRIAERGWIDRDTPIIQESLMQHGFHVDIVPWHSHTGWSAYQLAVLRSPWDLFFNREEFLSWLATTKTQTQILNAPSVVYNVLDKHYLQRIADADIPIVPTTFVEVGQKPSFPNVDFVVKPVISGGALNSARYSVDDQSIAKKHIAHLHAHSLAAMIQPYVTAIDTTGERALVFIDGTYSHAIIKDALLKPGEHFGSVRGFHTGARTYHPTAAEQEVAHAALESMATKDELLSGRVDLVMNADGSPWVMELELIAPVLFLAQNDSSVNRFVEALCKRLT